MVILREDTSDALSYWVEILFYDSAKDAPTASPPTYAYRSVF